MSNRFRNLVALLLACMMAVTPLVSQAGSAVVAGELERCDMMGMMPESGSHDHSASAGIPCELEENCGHACSGCTHCAPAAFLAATTILSELVTITPALEYHESFISAYSPQELRPPRNT
ncbi:MAG: hypothetical protein ABFS08_12445 [Pseudomonadota bacterium]